MDPTQSQLQQNASLNSGVASADTIQDLEMAPAQVKPENLPLDKKIQYLQKYNYYNDFEVDQYIDAQDSINQWCLGQVVQNDGKMICIHFDGWSTKWDLWHKIISIKVAPFRKYSKGYTGQQKHALRQNMTFNLEDLQQAKERMQKMTELDFEGYSAHEITQYLRGNLYVYIDFLLQGGNQPYIEDQIDAINDFIVNFLKLVVAWIKKLPSLLHLWSQVKVNSDLYLIDANVALLHSSFEIMETLKKIFGGCPRCIKYYFQNDKDAFESNQNVTKPFTHIDFAEKRRRNSDIDVDQMRILVAKNEEIIFGQIINFVNTFAELGGFDAIVDYLKQGTEYADGEKIPFEQFHNFTLAFRSTINILEPTFAKSFVNQVKDIFIQRIYSMSDKELKEVDKETISTALYEMREFFQLGLSQMETFEIIEKNQLQVALRFLKSTYLEKRLKGISEIKSFLDRLEYGQLNDYQFRQIQRGADQKNIKPPKWLTVEIMKDWILQEKVLEIVLGENTHSEIVKRGCCILKFLAKQGHLPIDSVDLIWKSQIGKHEEEVRVVYALISDLVPNMDQKFIDLFFQKIQEVPVAQYDTKYLEFLKEFTMRSLQSSFEAHEHETNFSEQQSLRYDEIINQREAQVIQTIKDHVQKAGAQPLGISEEKQYGLPIFWELAQDKMLNMSQELQQLSLNSLLQILKENYSNPIRINYLVKALENLIKGESVVQSIYVAQCVLQEFERYDYNDGRTKISQEQALIAIDRQLDLINIIIQNIKTYHSQVKEKVKVLTANKKTLPEDVATYIFVGKNTHESIIQRLLTFLQDIIKESSQKLTLGFENINTLWETFVLQPNFTFEQSNFLKWINSLEQPNQQNSIFKEEEKKYLFTQILCKAGNVSQISNAQVKCFLKYFKMINQQEDNIEVMRRRFRVTNYNRLIGLETLWQIAIDSENEKSREESTDLLVDLHLKTDPQYISQVDVWGNLISKCLAKLEQQESDQIVINTIQLVSKFLDRFDGRKILKNDALVNQYQNMQPAQVQIFNKADGQKKLVSISYFQTLGYLRQKIADAFDYQINEFQIIHPRLNSIIDPEDDDFKFVKDLGQTQQLLVIRNPNYNPDNHPKFLISSNPQNYELLFKLLQRNQNSKLIESTWDLLMKLPVNEILREEIRELKGVSKGQKSWDAILDPLSTNKLLYSLQIITNQNLNSRDQKSDMWLYKFVEKGGFSHLLNTFVTLQIDKIDTNLTLRCVEKLIIILMEFIKYDNKLVQQLLERRQEVTQKLIKLIDIIISYLIEKDNSRGYTMEDLTKKMQLNLLKKNKLKQYSQLPKDKQQTSTNDDDEDKDSQEYNLMQQLRNTQIEESKIVEQLFRFMHTTFGALDLQHVVSFSQYEGIQSLLIKASVQSENLSLRLMVLNNFRMMMIPKLNSAVQAKSLEEVKAQIEILALLLFKIQPKSEEFPERCSTFFETVSHIVEQFNISNLRLIQQQCEQLIIDLTKFIMGREIKEKNTQDLDILMNSKMRLLKALLRKFPHLKIVIGQQLGLTYHLLHDCLFQVPQGSSSKNQNTLQAPKSKNLISRRAATGLLTVLSRDCVENLDQVLSYMSHFNQHPSWRTNKDFDWEITPMDTEKSSTGYVGLKNLGCICYMNSLFQQLFMISSFRNDLLSVRDPKFDDAEKDDNMLYQLQMLFAGLLKSERQSVNPKGFCHAFKDWDGNPTNVMEQMDVEEFFNMIMDRIETAIKETPQKNTIQEHFGGKFASEMICKGCPHKYERSEPFLSISLAVKNKKSIYEGLQSFISGDMLEGDNAYKCEKCDKKVDALKRTCVKKPPKNLIIALRRFEFDYDKMIRVKVNDYCEFPVDLDIEPYTQEGLSRREKLQKQKEERGDDSQDPEPEMEPLKYPAEYYQYNLTGIVVHSGTADSGHYYSFIKDHDHPESGKWYELNDHIVRDFDPNDIPSETFGGEEIFTTFNMQQMKTMKWRNAYLLFYTRKVPEDIQDSADEAEQEESKNSQNIMDKSKVSISTAITANADVEMKNTTSTLDILEEIEEKIAYENTKYWQNRFLFGQEYPDFVKELTQTWNTSCIIPKEYLCYNDDQEITGQRIAPGYGRDTSIKEIFDEKLPINPERVAEMELKVFQFAAQYHITINQRSAAKNCVKEIIMALKAYMNKNPECARWLLNEFCNPLLIEEMFFQCKIKMMKKLLVGLLYCAMIKLYEMEKDKIPLYHQDPQNPENNQSILVNFSLVLITNIFPARKFLMHATHFFQLFARLSSLGPVMREFLCNCEVIGRLLEFIFDDVSPHKQRFRDLSIINPLINNKPDIGLPTEIDRKQLSHQQELIERRRLKQIQEGPMNFKYLLETVSNLLRHFQQGQFPQGVKSPLHLDPNYPTTYEGLHSDERDLVIPDPNFLRRTFDLAKKTRPIKCLALAYTHFAQQDQSYFERLYQTILNQLGELEAQEMRPYLVLLQTMLKYPGGADQQSQKIRFNTLIDVLIHVLKSNETYYKSMECLIEFFIKLCFKNPRVREAMIRNYQMKKLDFLENWNEETKYPFQNEGKVQLYKRKTHGFQTPQQSMKETFVKSTAAQIYRKKMFQEIFNPQSQVFLNRQDEPDLDFIEMQDYKFSPGETIELYTRRIDKFKQYEVLQVLDELLNVKQIENSQNNSNDGYYPQNQNNSFWIGTDSEKILPAETSSKIYALLLFSVFHKQQIQRYNQAQQPSNQRGVNSQRFGPHTEDYGNHNDYDGRGGDANFDGETQGGRGQQHVRSQVPGQVQHAINSIHRQGNGGQRAANNSPSTLGKRRKTLHLPNAAYKRPSLEGRTLNSYKSNHPPKTTSSRNMKKELRVIRNSYLPYVDQQSPISNPQVNVEVPSFEEQEQIDTRVNREKNVADAVRPRQGDTSFRIVLTSKRKRKQARKTQKVQPQAQSVAENQMQFWHQFQQLPPQQQLASLTYFLQPEVFAQLSDQMKQQFLEYQRQLQINQLRMQLMSQQAQQQQHGQYQGSLNNQNHEQVPQATSHQNPESYQRNVDKVENDENNASYDILGLKGENIQMREDLDNEPITNQLNRKNLRDSRSEKAIEDEEEIESDNEKTIEQISKEENSDREQDYSEESSVNNQDDI